MKEWEIEGRRHELTRYRGKLMCRVCGHKFCWILAYYKQDKENKDPYLHSEIGRFNQFETGPIYNQRGVTKLLYGIVWGEFYYNNIPDDAAPF